MVGTTTLLVVCVCPSSSCVLYEAELLLKQAHSMTGWWLRGTGDETGKGGR